MRISPPRNGFAAGLVGIALLAGCSTSTPPQPSPGSPTSPTPPAAPSPASAKLVPASVDVSGDLAQSPFDEPRQALVPEGWTLSVWARIPEARLAAWTPDNALLVSIPESGQIVKLTPTPGAARKNRCCSKGWTNHTDWRSRVRPSMSPRATRSTPTTTPTGRPPIGGRSRRASRRKKPRSAGRLRPRAQERRCRPATARSTSRSARQATSPPRTAPRTRRAPPSCGSRPAGPAGHSRPASATAPGWRSRRTVRCGRRSTTATTSPNPTGPSYGQVIQEYVNEHPPESVARLTPGRELGWPYCNSDGGPGATCLRPRRANQRRRQPLTARPAPRRAEPRRARRAAGHGFSRRRLPAPYASGALVGVHGSWNREPPRAPEVAFFPWQDGNLGQPADPRRRFPGRRRHAVGPPGRRGGGPDGAVYITDDYADAVYRLAPPGDDSSVLVPRATVTPR